MAICPLKCLISFHVFLSPSIVRVSSISARLVLDNPNKGVSESKGIEGSHSPPHRPLKGRRRSVSGKKTCWCHILWETREVVSWPLRANELGQLRWRTLWAATLLFFDGDIQHPISNWNESKKNVNVQRAVHAKWIHNHRPYLRKTTLQSRRIKICTFYRFVTLGRSFPANEIESSSLCRVTKLCVGFCIPLVASTTLFSLLI